MQTIELSKEETLSMALGKMSQQLSAANADNTKLKFNNKLGNVCLLVAAAFMFALSKDWPQPNILTFLGVAFIVKSLFV